MGSTERLTIPIYLPTISATILAITTQPIRFRVPRGSRATVRRCELHAVMGLGFTVVDRTVFTGISKHVQDVVGAGTDQALVESLKLFCTGIVGEEIEGLPTDFALSRPVSNNIRDFDEDNQPQATEILSTGTRSNFENGWSVYCWALNGNSVIAAIGEMEIVLEYLRDSTSGPVSIIDANEQESQWL